VAALALVNALLKTESGKLRLSGQEIDIVPTIEKMRSTLEKDVFDDRKIPFWARIKF
jgi:hypothetical protein